MLRNYVRVLFTLQNAVALAVFSVIAFAEIAALLLEWNPRSTWFWIMSVKLNRLTEPALNAFGFMKGQQGWVIWAVVATLCMAPIIAYAKNYRLMTSALCHLALGMCIVSASDVLQQFFVQHKSASLSSIIDVSFMDANVGTTTAAVIVLGLLCFASHILYLVTMGQAIRQAAGHENAPTSIRE